MQITTSIWCSSALHNGTLRLGRLDEPRLYSVLRCSSMLLCAHGGSHDLEILSFRISQRIGNIESVDNFVGWNWQICSVAKFCSLGVLILLHYSNNLPSCQAGMSQARLYCETMFANLVTLETDVWFEILLAIFSGSSVYFLYHLSQGQVI